MSQALLERLRHDFLGLDRVDPVVDGGQRRRIYLDSGATTLMPRMVHQALGRYFQGASANSHTEAHRAGRDTTQAIEDSRAAIGRLVGYDPKEDVVLFTANGATGAINFLARALFPPEIRPVIKRFSGAPPNSFVSDLKHAVGEHGSNAIDVLMSRPIVVTTAMEHHSNLLPWMEAVGHHNLRAIETRSDDGTLDMDSFRSIMAEDGHRVRLVALTGLSNVTGIINPVHEIAAVAHQYGAQIMVDGAQWVPHSPVNIRPADPSKHIDYLALSGHKLYAPGSRGALIGNLQTLSNSHCVTDVGGGMVEYVSIEDFLIKEEVTAREEAGTPNIPGSISMGIIAGLLHEIGMPIVAEDEDALSAVLIERLKEIPGITLYGSLDQKNVPRAGVVAFNVDHVDHGLVAAYLNDFHNIAVRNGCFCAHPYVKRLLLTDPLLVEDVHWMVEHPDRYDVPRPGMVRASLGIYSTAEDIEALAVALETLVADRDPLTNRYTRDAHGNFLLSKGDSLPSTFGVSEEIASWIEDRS